jgi:hypothetical protein
MRCLAGGAMVAAIIATTSLPGWCQEAPPTDERTTLQDQLDQREKADQARRDQAAEADKAYQRLLKSSGTAPAPKVDPWGNVRSAEPKSNSQSKNTK